MRRVPVGEVGHGLCRHAGEGVEALDSKGAHLVRFQSSHAPVGRIPGRRGRRRRRRAVDEPEVANVRIQNVVMVRNPQRPAQPRQQADRVSAHPDPADAPGADLVHQPPQTVSAQPRGRPAACRPQPGPDVADGERTVEVRGQQIRCARVDFAVFPVFGEIEAVASRFRIAEHPADQFRDGHIGMGRAPVVPEKHTDPLPVAVFAETERIPRKPLVDPLSDGVRNIDHPDRMIRRSNHEQAPVST